MNNFYGADDEKSDLQKIVNAQLSEIEELKKNNRALDLESSGLAQAVTDAKGVCVGVMRERDQLRSELKTIGTRPSPDCRTCVNLVSDDDHPQCKFWSGCTDGDQYKAAIPLALWSSK